MSAHDIPDTAEVRASMAKAQASGMADLGLASSKVEVWEDGYRAAAHADSTFEWWYFDCQFSDGSTLVVTFSNKPHTNPHGPLTPTMLVIHHGPDGKGRRIEKIYDPSEFSAAVDSCDVRIGPNTVTGNLDEYVMHLDVEGLKADVTIERKAPSWRPGAGISYFDSKRKDFLAWVVPVPYGTVTADIEDQGAAVSLEGAAYHDHNWGNQLMGDFLDHWYWGRAHVGDYTLVYVRMTTKGLFGFGSINIPTFFLAKGDQLLTDDLIPLRLTTVGEQPGPGGHTYPNTLAFTWSTDAGHVEFTITNPSLIEALDLRTPQHGLAALMHAGEHPEYYDFNADIDLRIDLNGVKDHVKGRTLFEKMMFR